MNKRVSVRPGNRSGAIAAQLVALELLSATLGGCTRPQQASPIEVPIPPPLAQIDPADPSLRSTIVGGEAEVPIPPVRGSTGTVKGGNIRLNFPSADILVVAKAVLGDMLGLDYSIAPGTTGRVSLVTPGPVARSEILNLFEAALRTANLALVQQGPRSFIIQPVAAASANGPVGDNALGFGTKIVTLKFINAEEAKKLLDGVIPGVVSSIDTAGNRLTLAGTSGQRQSADDLIRQFDVDWLRNMSFGLFIPQRTDSRLIVPELDKLINAPDAPTRGVVRLLSMERMNGILAITSQRQYLDDIKRWIDILDREGESNEARLFVYRVQNGRARDLARTLNEAFTGNAGSGGEDPSAPFAPGATGGLSNSASGSPPPQAPLSNGGAPLGTLAGPSNGSPNKSGGGTSGQESSNSLAAAQNDVGRITSDDINNAVVVYGTPRQYAVVEDALRKLDVPPYQVLIEAAITEVSLTDGLQFGVNWNFLQGKTTTILNDGTIATNTPATPAQGFNFFYGSSDISATLSALEKRTNVKVISAPKILVLNNQTASLQVGDQVPVQTQAQQPLSTNGGTANVLSSIEYRDTGVILKVTPRVNSGGLVLLDVAQEVSNVKSVGTGTLDSPTISTRRIATSVAIQDGQVIALGGLFSDNQSFGKNGVPYLSRIPVLGALFGNHNNTQTRTELIVLLKPHVIRTVDDGRAVTEELRAKLRTLEPFKTQGKIP